MRRVLLVISFILILASMWIGLTKGRAEGPKGDPESPMRNMVYAHVPSSIAALACFTVLMIASIGYLRTGKDGYDRLAAASAEVGTVFAVILNATGSVFSRAEWGVWWTAASLRLQTSAILLFLYVVYLILRTSLPGSKQRRGKIAAVFGIIAFLDVPMVFISARLVRDTMHIDNVGFTSLWQRIPFGLGILGILMLAGVLISMRTEVMKCRALLEEQE